MLLAEVSCYGNIFVMELTIEEFDLLTRCPLFHGIGREKLREMLSCLHARRETFAPGAFLLREGDRAQEVGLVLSGQGRVLVRNYLSSLAEKSLVLNSRISCLARRTVREKVLAYLTQAAAQKGIDPQTGGEFSVPLDRNAMAAYLNIDRTALSRELSRMKQEGLIDFHKDRFRLLKGPGSR